jgi:hypothetical protein
LKKAAREEGINDGQKQVQIKNSIEDIQRKTKREET